MIITQEVRFSANPEKVYEVLMSGSEFGAATGTPAEIGQEVGSAFQCFGGLITGRHIELIPNQRIVQAWRVGMWPEGVYSIVRFDITADGDSTKLTLCHTAFPEDAADHLESGWHQKYWEPLKAYIK